MKALPLPCMRPSVEYVTSVATPPYIAGVHDAASLQQRIEDGLLVKDDNLAYYLYERKQNSQTLTGLVAVSSFADYDAGAITNSKNEDYELQSDYAERIRTLRCQSEPVVLAYPDQPVLDMIINAAKTATPLYSLSDAKGATQRIWEVVRPDSVAAIRAMIDQISHTEIVDGQQQFAAALAVARDMRESLQKAGTYTGKEPFNYVLSILFPASQLQSTLHTDVIHQCSGLFLHRIAKQ